VAIQPKVELVVVGFNYDLLETKLADKVRSAADRIREWVKKTVEDIIEVGNDLLAVKEVLAHGQFLTWLKAEFGWSKRSAQNFMSVAEQFKSARIADLPIQPSATLGPRGGAGEGQREGRGRRRNHLRSGQGDCGRGEEEEAAKKVKDDAGRKTGWAPGNGA
jgi:hypothetical protein